MPCIKEPVERKSCSFERIYFQEAAMQNLSGKKRVRTSAMQKYFLPAVDNDLRNTVFSFIPNTAEVAFMA